MEEDCKTANESLDEWMELQTPAAPTPLIIIQDEITHSQQMHQPSKLYQSNIARRYLRYDEPLDDEQNDFKNISEADRVDMCKKKCDEIVDFFKKNTQESHKILLPAFTDLNSSFSILRLKFSKSSCCEVAEYMVTGGLESVLIHLVMTRLQMEDLDCLTSDFNGSVDEKDDKSLFNHAFGLLLNASDLSDHFAESICNSDKLLDKLIIHLGLLCSKIKSQPEKVIKAEIDFATQALGVLHNCARRDNNKTLIHSYNLLPLLLSYINNCIADEHRLSAILCLLDISTEEELKQFVGHSRGIDYLLTNLADAASSDNWCSLGYSADELATAVGQLALNAENCRMLVLGDVIKTLRRMLLRSLGDDEQDADSKTKAAISALWALSFDNYSRSKMVSEPFLIDTLRRLLTDTKVKVVDEVKRIIWNLRYELEESEAFHDLGAQFTRIEGLSSPSDKHIMISYNWTHQDLMLKIRDFLKSRGFRVWMDVDNMKGSTLESMASAVENCAAVIVGLSKKYRESKFCRLEFEYAFKQNKLIVPIKLQKQYEPDSWLGLVINNRLYHDLSDGSSFRSKMNGVLKALDEAEDISSSVTAKAASPVKKTVVEDVIVPKTLSESSQPAPLNSGSAKSWTNEQVQKWLKTCNLEKYDTLTHMTGKDLVFLMKLKMEAPDYFYRVTERHVGLSDLRGLIDFHTSLTDLFL